MADIEKFNEEINLILLTVEQLNKDLTATGFEITFSGNKATALLEITMQLENCIHQIQKKNNSLLRVWMYRVDIAENVFKKIVSSDEYEKRLAKAIVERTFIKIVFRQESKKKI